MSRLPTIPDFTETIASMATALRTLKLGMEILGGLRPGGQSQGAPLIFVQGKQPAVAMDNSRRRGDLWIDTDNDALCYWDGNGWHGLTGLNVVRTFISADAPTVPVRINDLWIDSDTNVQSRWDGAAWVALA